MPFLLRTTLAAFALLALVHARAAAQPRERPGFVRYDAPVLVLEHVQVIDGRGGPPRADQTVVLENGRIRGVGPSGRVEVPAEAVRVDLAGRTVMPGLVMLHEHLTYFSGQSVWDAHPVSYPRLYLAAGVTTIRTAGSESPQVDLNVRRAIEAGRMAGPRIFVTGPYLNGEEGSFLGDYVVADAAEARRVVGFWADRGATSFKAYAGIGEAALAGAVEEAHARGLTVIGHLGSISCTRAAALGIDGIEHSFASCMTDLGARPDQPFTATPADSAAAALIRTLVEADVVLTATPMGTVRQRIPDEELAMLGQDERARYLSLIGEPPPWLPAPETEAALRRLEREFVRQGGRLAIGADAADFGQIAGFANHRALIQMVDGGFTPLEVLRMASHGGAVILGMGDELGIVEAGRLADLVVLSGDPSRDISAVRTVEMVIKNGIAYDPAALRTSVQGMVGRH